MNHLLKRVIPPLVVVCLVFAAGCSTLGIKTWHERTAKEKAQTMMEAYNRQFNDTMAAASSPGPLSDAQKEIVRTKIAILEKAWPAIRMYDEIVVGGGVPSVELEQDILDFLDRLVGIGG